jgi:hypothetical protein
LNPTTGVVDLLFSIWIKPQVLLGSFSHFQQNHGCGQPTFPDLDKTTLVVDLFFSVCPKPQMWAVVSFSHWQVIDPMTGVHRINSPLFMNPNKLIL